MPIIDWPSSGSTYESRDAKVAPVHAHLNLRVRGVIAPDQLIMVIGLLARLVRIGGRFENDPLGILWHLFPKNPCRFVTVPKRNEPKRRSLGQEKGIRLLEEIDKTEAEESEVLREGAAPRGPEETRLRAGPRRRSEPEPATRGSAQLLVDQVLATLSPPPRFRLYELSHAPRTQH